MDARLEGYLALLAPPPSEASLARAPAVEPPDASFWRQLQEAGLPWRCGALVITHLLATAAMLFGWAAVGSGALSGRLDAGWLLAFGLALGSTVPLRFASRWLEGVIAVGFGGVLKQRLFAGALRIDVENIRRKGSGRVLSECLEAEAVEAVGASGGLQITLALLELVIVPVLLLWGAAPLLQVFVFAVTAAAFTWLALRDLELRSRWTHERLGLTCQLVENMSAHRTRLSQQPPSEWHLAEDRDVERYVRISERLDRSQARIQALPWAYSIAAVAALSPSVLSNGATPEQMAIALGTVLFAATAWERLGSGFFHGAEAWLAWRFAKPLADAARDDTGEGGAIGAASLDTGALVAVDLAFRHDERAEPILSRCSLSLERGERVLVEGDPGSGKSTLAALLGGLRQPAAGFVLAGGLDRYTLGDRAFRQRVAVAPQYHENHVLSASLAFNLLLSRPYPHTEADHAEAHELCRELGLSELLERMPSGLHQIVGETGWRLSQGERSRVFLARALLQRASVVVLDESLAALDPATLEQCLACAVRRADTLIVIAHP